jgi:hypothetical protein
MHRHQQGLGCQCSVQHMADRAGPRLPVCDHLSCTNLPAGMPLSSYVWDLSNPNVPEAKLLGPSQLVCAKFNVKDANLVGAGQFNGQFSYFDTRKGTAPVDATPMDVCHRSGRALQRRQLQHSMLTDQDWAYCEPAGLGGADVMCVLHAAVRAGTLCSTLPGSSPRRAVRRSQCQQTARCWGGTYASSVRWWTACPSGGCTTRAWMSQAFVSHSRGSAGMHLHTLRCPASAYLCVYVCASAGRRAATQCWVVCLWSTTPQQDQPSSWSAVSKVCGQWKKSLPTTACLLLQHLSDVEHGVGNYSSCGPNKKPLRML